MSAIVPDAKHASRASYPYSFNLRPGNASIRLCLPSRYHPPGFCFGGVIYDAVAVVTANCYTAGVARA